jgi:hypothetical protein
MTINALFYNIHTREVEDFTGKVLLTLMHHSNMTRERSCRDWMIYVKGKFELLYLQEKRSWTTHCVSCVA